MSAHVLWLFQMFWLVFIGLFALSLIFVAACYLFARCKGWDWKNMTVEEILKRDWSAK